MSNYNKNLFVGLGGKDAIDLSHFIGACYGMERMMGKADNPLRRILNRAADDFLQKLPLVRYILGRNTVYLYLFFFACLSKRPAGLLLGRCGVFCRRCLRRRRRCLHLGIAWRTKRSCRHSHRQSDGSRRPCRWNNGTTIVVNVVSV